MKTHPLGLTAVIAQRIKIKTASSQEIISALIRDEHEQSKVRNTETVDPKAAIAQPNDNERASTHD